MPCHAAQDDMTLMIYYQSISHDMTLQSVYAVHRLNALSCSAGWLSLTTLKSFMLKFLRVDLLRSVQTDDMLAAQLHFPYTRIDLLLLKCSNTCKGIYL